MEQKSLRQIFEHVSTSNESYEFEFPTSVCYGVAVLGGITMAAIHKAAVDFVSKSLHTSSHNDVVHVALQFYRPTLPAPQKAWISCSVSNTNRASTTLHDQLVQRKECIAGYVTLTNLSATGYTQKTLNSTLAPAPLPTSIQSLESDHDADWIEYYSPLELCGSCKVQSYVRTNIPRQEPSRFKNDAWVTPGWEDKGRPGDVLWTNELVHFLLDNGIPPLYADLMHKDKTRRIYDQFVAAGLAQRKARLEGKSDRIRGEGLTDEEFVPYSLATMTVTTEIKKLLPQNGTKWLFMRTQTTGVQDGRIEYDVTIMDEVGSCIAVSHQIHLVIPLSSKNTKL